MSQAVAAEVPQEVRLAKDGRALTLVYGEKSYVLSAEYLRVCSPSAEVRGHGGAWTCIAGKREVAIKNIVPVGQYALRLLFSDGHDSGIFSWEVLQDLSWHQERYWQQYLQALSNEGKTREQV